jgi:hypothetical protein
MFCFALAASPWVITRQGVTAITPGWSLSSGRTNVTVRSNYGHTTLVSREWSGVVRRRVTSITASAE